MSADCDRVKVRSEKVTQQEEMPTKMFTNQYKIDTIEQFWIFDEKNVDVDQSRRRKKLMNAGKRETKLKWRLKLHDRPRLSLYWRMTEIDMLKMEEDEEEEKKKSVENERREYFPFFLLRENSSAVLRPFASYTR